MTDQEKWETAINAIALEYQDIPAVVRLRVDALLEKLVSAKLLVHAYADHLQAADICASCGGQCCLTGKYHFTVVELLVYLHEGKPLFAPRFDSGLCPYLGDTGCLMGPSHRPYNCITFNCELVDGLLEPHERERFVSAELELRSCYEEIEKLFGNRFLQGLLINCDRDLLEQRNPVLRGSGGNRLA